MARLTFVKCSIQGGEWLLYQGDRVDQVDEHSLENQLWLEAYLSRDPRLRMWST